MPVRPDIKALLIDISGNLHIGAKPTANAIQAMQRLRASEIPFRLCSNSSKESTSDLVIRLRNLGFELTHTRAMKEVWTSIGSVARFLQQLDVKSPYLLLSKSAREEVLAELRGSTSPPETFKACEERYDSVVVGLAPEMFDYAHLNTAFRILVGENDHSGRRQAPLIATHKGKYVEKDDPPGLSLGPGPFVTALENASATRAHVVGKPTKAFFQLVMNDFSNIQDGKTAVIGDDIEADLGGGALELGLWRVLVKTGKYRPGDERREGNVPPDEVYDCFADFVDNLLQRQMKKPDFTLCKW